MRYALHGTRYAKGIAALATIITMSAFLLAVGILVLIRGGTSVTTGQYAAQAERAQFLAEAGVQDSLIKLARNKDYSSAGYTISENDGITTVSVTQGSQVVILSTARVTQADAIITRVIRAEVTLDSNGKITAITQANL